MLLKKGIVRKTFLFSALLTVLVTFAAFAVLYYTMPGYYHKTKKEKLQESLHTLTVQLISAQTEASCAALISQFSDENNVNVLSFDKDDVLLPALSTPFASMPGLKDTLFISSFEQIESESDGRQNYSILIRNNENKADDMPAHVMFKISTANASHTMTLQGSVGTDYIDHVLVSGTLQPIDEAKEVILSLSPYVLIIAIFIGIILSWVYAQQISKPILKISDAALRMQRMEPKAVSNIRTKDELGQLSINLDALYASLRKNIAYLQDEMEKVNRLERSKTEMMQSASHELKTPIAALNGMIEGMIDHVGSYKDKEKYLLECKKQVDKLSLLVNEILGASKFDIADDELVYEELSVNELLEHILDENSHHINEKRLNLLTETPPVHIKTDPGIFRRVLGNLISNAVRYTPVNGRIFLSIYEDGHNRYLSIENECDFVPEEELQKMFEPFYTRSYSRSKTESGTGLGLHIVRLGLERLNIPYKAVSTDLGLKITMQL